MSTRRTLRRAVSVIAAIDLMLLVASLPFVAIVAMGVPDRNLAFELASRLFFAPFLAIAFLVLRRHPSNGAGWALLGGTTAMVVNEFALAYAGYALPRSMLGGIVAAWLSSWIWFPAFGAIGALFLFFPTGRPLSRRWAIVGWVGLVGLLFTMAGNALWQRPIDGFEPLQNPYGIGGRAGDVFLIVWRSAAILLPLSILLAGISLVVRFRRSRGIERQQLKWFVFAAILVAVSVFGVGATFREGADPTVMAVTFQALLVGSILFMAVALGIAILRYRLYDIDVVINRAAVYSVLTAILAGLYVAIVFGLQVIVAPVTEQSDIAIAASTLAVAALFRPIRARVQDLIDRRFYRRKFDIQRTLDEFSTDLRNEVDLDALSARLTGVIGSTMQPAHVSIWLREEARA